MERDGAIVGIVSAQGGEIVRKLCVSAGIDQYVSYLVGHAQNKVGPIKSFCRVNKISRRNVWFVGDFPSDMRDGKKARVRRVGITRGNPVGDLLIKAGAQACIKHLRELPRAIGRTVNTRQQQRYCPVSSSPFCTGFFFPL